MLRPIQTHICHRLSFSECQDNLQCHQSFPANVCRRKGSIMFEIAAPDGFLGIIVAQTDPLLEHTTTAGY